VALVNGVAVASLVLDGLDFFFRDKRDLKPIRSWIWNLIMWETDLGNLGFCGWLGSVNKRVWIGNWDLSALLVLTDLTKSDGSWPESVWLFQSADGPSGLASRLGRQLVTWRLSRGFASGLLKTSHWEIEGFNLRNSRVIRDWGILICEWEV
jgi:hypothetical protein